MNKIKIQEDKLRKMYENEKLSTRTIAKTYGCCQGVILRELREHGIDIRHPNEEINLSSEVLNNLYTIKNLSTYKIAKIFKCDNKTIYRKLKQFDIPTRTIIKIQIPKGELYRLYHNEKWPLSQIAKKFSCCVDPVFDRMKEYGIKTRTMSEAKTIYPKQDFSGNLCEKAYLIGFRLGDLNVYQNYHSVCVQTSTTITKQVELLRRIFSGYSNVSVKKYNDKAFHIQVRLNKTFKFLLPKEDLIENWIFCNESYFFAFFAGYFDAEGNVQNIKNRFRLRVRSCDKNLLFMSHQKLQSIGIRSLFRLECRAGVYNEKILNKDFWCLSINRQEDIEKLKAWILPHLKHTNKINTLIR